MSSKDVSKVGYAVLIQSQKNGSRSYEKHKYNDFVDGSGNENGKMLKFRHS